MIRMLCALQIIFHLTSYGQDTLAVVDTKPRSTVEVFRAGDTTFVRSYFNPAQTGLRGSTGSWYVSKQNKGDVDLNAIGYRPLYGIKRSGNHTTYYSLESQRKAVTLVIFGSNDGEAAAEVARMDLEGISLGSVDRGTHFTICTFIQKTGTVNVYEFVREKLIAKKEIKIPYNFKRIKDEEIAFLGPGGAESVGMPVSKVKFFLQGDSFASVVDDNWEEYVEGKTMFTTNVFRKNLATGAEDIDVFMSTEKYSFNSYVRDNILYRLVCGKPVARLSVHDLDLNKLVYERDVTSLDNSVAYDRREAKHEIEAGKGISFDDIMPVFGLNVGLSVDGPAADPTVTLGYVYNDKAGVVPVAIPFFGIMAPIATGGRASHDHMKYTYLTGPKLDIASSNTNNIEMKIDEFEIKTLKDRHLKYRWYVPGNDTWVGVYSAMGGNRYVLIKFDR